MRSREAEPQSHKGFDRKERGNKVGSLEALRANHTICLGFCPQGVRHTWPQENP